jgi:uncharacterized protein
MDVPARVSLVTLGVSDLRRSTAFYRSLGWRPSSVSNAEVSFFRTADCVLALYPFRALAADAGIEAGDRPAVGSVTLAINVDGEDLVGEILGQAAEAGATVVRPGRATTWGGYIGYFADPDGHLWEVAHNPGFPLDADGSVVLPD